MSKTREEVLAIALKQACDLWDQSVIEEDTFSDLGLDSLDAVEFVMALEDEFDIEIDDDKAYKVTSVKGMVDLLMTDYLS